MTEKFCIFKAINHMLLPDGSESGFGDSDEDEAELLKLTENDLDLDYNLNLNFNIFAFSTITKKVNLITILRKTRRLDFLIEKSGGLNSSLQAFD